MVVELGGGVGCALRGIECARCSTPLACSSCTFTGISLSSSVFPYISFVIASMEVSITSSPSSSAISLASFCARCLRSLPSFSLLSMLDIVSGASPSLKMNTSVSLRARPQLKNEVNKNDALHDNHIMAHMHILL